MKANDNAVHHKGISGINSLLKKEEPMGKALYTDLKSEHDDWMLDPSSQE